MEGIHSWQVRKMISERYGGRGRGRNSAGGRFGGRGKTSPEDSPQRLEHVRTSGSTIALL